MCIRDRLFTDAFSLLQFLDDMSDDEHNRFTKRDILEDRKSVV